MWKVVASLEGRSGLPTPSTQARGTGSRRASGVADLWRLPHVVADGKWKMYLHRPQVKAEVDSLPSSADVCDSRRQELDTCRPQPT